MDTQIYCLIKISAVFTGRKEKMITIKSVINDLMGDLEKYGNLEIKKLRIEYDNFDREQHARQGRGFDFNDDSESILKNIIPGMSGV